MSRGSSVSALPVLPSSSSGVGCTSELRGELALTHIAVCVTVIASVLSLGGILLSLVEDVAVGRWVSSLGQGLFLAIVSFLIYGGLVYQFARLGHFNRLRQHRRAAEDELDRFFHVPRPAAVTILVPSYKEDPLVVRRTLLSAALQDYPRRRVVLVIDDPPHSGQASDIRLLSAARGLAAEIQETLRKPRDHFEDALRAFLERRARGPLDARQEMQRLAQLYRDAASWFEQQGAGYSLGDHADALFVEITSRIPATASWWTPTVSSPPTTRSACRVCWPSPETRGSPSSRRLTARSLMPRAPWNESRERRPTSSTSFTRASRRTGRRSGWAPTRSSGKRRSTTLPSPIPSAATRFGDTSRITRSSRTPNRPST